MAVYCMRSAPGLRKRRWHHDSAEEGSVYLLALGFFAFVFPPKHRDILSFRLKKAFHITSGFCPVLSRREKDECARRTPKRKGDVGPSSGRQGAGQRAGQIKLCPPVWV